MKTNQLMDVAFSKGNVQVFHKTAMGDLTQLFNVGNSFRLSEGKAIMPLAKFKETKAFKEFTLIVESNIKGKALTVSGKGRGASTWANIHLMIYAAEYLSSQFHFEVIDAFINGKLLEYRDESGDQFKALNRVIDDYLPNREGKDNKGVYIQVAKAIKAKIDPELTSWNFATADNLQQRLKYENSLVTVLQLGVVSDYNHLKELINKL
jgi:hypothetical protein